MDALDAAITSIDVTGPLTTEHLAQLLRGLAKTITGKFDILLAKKNSEIKELNTRVTELENKCDELEQYSRRNVIPEKAGEETDVVVRELAAIMRNGKKLKGSQIFVNDDMTRIRGKIAWEARQLRRDGKVSIPGRVTG